MIKKNPVYERDSAIQFENEHVRIWIEEDIVFGLYKQDAIVTLEAAREIVKNRLLLQKGKEYPALVFVSHGLTIITPEARKYFAVHGYNGISKMAIVTNSQMKVFLVNIYISIDRPVKPTKLFKSEEKGLEWLRKK